MASIAYPGTAGSYIGGFLGGQQHQAGLNQSRLAQGLSQLRLMSGLDELQQQQALRSIVPQVAAMQPQPMEIAPGTPPQPPTLLGTDYDAFAQGTPGTPPVTQNMLTQGMVAQQVGPQGLATLLTTPQGRAILEAKGVLSEEEAERRRKRAKALNDYRTAARGINEAYVGGRAMEGLAKEIAARQALAEAADDPLPHLDRVAALTKMYMAESEKKDQEQRRNNDMIRMGSALAAYQAKPDFDTFAGVQKSLLEAESDFGRTKAYEFLWNMAQGKADEIKFMPFQKVVSRAAQIMTAQADATNQVPDWGPAIRQAMSEDPDSAARIFGAMVTGKDKPNEFWTKIFLGEGITPPKNVWDEAVGMAKARGLVPTSTDFWKFVSTTVTQLEKDRQRAAREGDRETNLVTQQNSLATRERALMAELRSARERRDTQAEAELTDELDDIRARLKGIQTELERKGAAPKPIREPKPLPVAKQAPAALETKDPARYEEQARAEVKRLIRSGHSKESAITEMRRRGWSVK